MTKEEFTRLALSYTDMVFRIAINMLKSPSAADDVCQEVFLRLWKSGKIFQSEDHAKNWIIRVAINESKRSIASGWNKTEDIDDYSRILPVKEAEYGELLSAVMELPRKYRIVIYLHYYEGYSTPEIAKLMKVPEATVRTQLRRGRESLKNKLKED